MSNNRNPDLYDRPRSFSGSSDYQNFLHVLISDPEFVEVPVMFPFANVGEVEKWYKSTSTQEIWRLVEPDAPFRGVWEPVSKETLEQ